MKKMVFYAVLFVATAGFLYAQVNLTHSSVYTWPVKTTTTYDSVLSGLEGIRCVTVGDLNNDGKPEIVATNYSDLGHVHAFALAGKDSFELVWSSPRVDSNGGNSSPRNVLIGDLDNDGRAEIIYESRGNGIYIFESDGGAGFNFGTKPSQLINSNTCPGFSANLSGATYIEKMSLSDVDNDGQQELIVAVRSSASAEQKYMIIKATGNWDTDEPGFSGFELPFVAARNDMSSYGFSGGSAFGTMAANLDGTGFKEIVLQAYNKNDVTIARHNGTNWVLADTMNGKQNLYLTSQDGVSYFGALVYDIDGDGRDEVYFPTNVRTDPDPPGIIHVLYYDSPKTVNEIDSTNVFTLDFSPITGTNGMWGYGYGDIDGNGKPNLYFATDKLGAAIVTAEFEGGDKKDPNNWKLSSLFIGDSTDHSITIRDSSGVIDTAHVNEFLFPSKIFAAKTDVDGDGNEDIVAGYQPWYYGAPGTDSIAVSKKTWNTGTNQYDSVSLPKIQNPKRYGFVILTKSSATGVSSKELTFITPEDYKLNQNFPNPFNPSTNITFVLPLNKNVTVKIYDMLGKEVKTLLNNEPLAKGTHSLTWDARDNHGKQVASGAYIFRMNAGNVEKTMKMMLIK